MCVSGCVHNHVCLFMNAQNLILKWFIILQQVEQLYIRSKKQIDDARVLIAGVFAAFTAPHTHEREARHVETIIPLC